MSKMTPDPNPALRADAKNAKFRPNRTTFALAFLRATQKIQKRDAPWTFSLERRRNSKKRLLEALRIGPSSPHAKSELVRTKTAGGDSFLAVFANVDILGCAEEFFRVFKVWARKVGSREALASLAAPAVGQNDGSLRSRFAPPGRYIKQINKFYFYYSTD